MSRQMISFLAAGVLVIIIAAVLVGVNEKNKFERELRSLYNQKQQVINADSLRNVIEARVVDSIKTRLEKHDQALAALKKDLTKTRKKNEELEKMFRSISVSMPEF